MSIETIGAGTALQTILSRLLVLWPEHRKFLTKSFESRSLQLIQHDIMVAEMINKIIQGNLDEYLEDYRWTCGIIYETEIEFRRSGHYRYSTLKEVNQDIYGNPSYMKRYLAGLLISQLMWSNHAGVFHHYEKNFLAGNTQGYKHLEIGPGHGLFLALAAADTRCQSAEGWDISETAVKSTRECLSQLQVPRNVHLQARDAMAVNDSAVQFDSIVFSEVLEHMENPVDMLRASKKLLTKNGRIFINIPINSPAPDHIYLLRSPEEAATMIETAGFRVVESQFYALSGYTEEAARKKDLTISCAFTIV